MKQTKKKEEEKNKPFEYIFVHTFFFKFLKFFSLILTYEVTKIQKKLKK